MNATQRICEVAEQISTRAADAASPEFDRPLRRLRQAAQRVGQAWCGSWLPGLSHLYDEALRPLADGAGGRALVGAGLSATCVEWPDEVIRQTIHEAAGRPDITALTVHSARLALWVQSAKSTCRAVLEEALRDHGPDATLARLAAELEQVGPVEREALLRAWSPVERAFHRSAVVSRDAVVPPHLCELAAIESVRSPVAALSALASVMGRAADRCRALDDDEPGAVFQATRPVHRNLGSAALRPGRGA